MKFKITLALLFFSFFQMVELLAQNNTEEAENTEEVSHVFGLSWNTASLVSNYPSIMLSANYQWKRKLSLELGGSSLLNSELFTTSKNHLDHKGGYKLLAEINYFFNQLHDGNGPYAGIGYSHLESTFQANYIVKIYNEDGDRYFRYVDQEYHIRMNQYYAKAGYHITIGQRVFFDLGLNVGIFNKKVSPPPSDFGGKLVTNKRFMDNINRYGPPFLPIPFSLDLKIGIIFFKK